MSISPYKPFPVLDSSPIGHFILDQELKICCWNRCLENWTGLFRRDMIGHSLCDHFPHLVEPKYLNRIEEVLRGGPPTTFSSQLHKHFIPSPLPGGRLRVQHTVVTSLATVEPDRHLALFSIQDVTSLTEAIDQHTEALHRLTAEAEERQREVQRRKEAEESLREIDSLKNEFIASAAHELNTPLSTIHGYAEMLQDQGGYFDDAQKVEFVNEIIESSERLTKIIGDLLDAATFDQGRGLQLEKSLVDPEGLIRKVFRHFKNYRAKHVFVLDLSIEKSRAINIDPMRIRQVLENIFSNAIKYSPIDTTITIRSSWDASGVTVVITDQGFGMNKEQVAKVFDKYFRVDSSNTVAHGLGLGMSIVRQIIDQHGGTITVESAPSQGTAVTFYLPN